MATYLKQREANRSQTKGFILMGTISSTVLHHCLGLMLKSRRVLETLLLEASCDVIRAVFEMEKNEIGVVVSML